MHFLIVDLANNVSLDYYETTEHLALQHFAFLVSDDEFEPILDLIRGSVAQIWADPGRSQPGQINHHFGGRGVYFEDPDGHLFEVITRPYANT
jgi:catechol 2,3-dioxygenase-like lactoylglutathione lyase family enzyme